MPGWFLVGFVFGVFRVYNRSMKHAAKALIRDDQGKILVLYRSETHPYLAHDIDLPGGEIEHDELTEAGLMREISEETGLMVRCQTDDLVSSWPSFFGSTHMLYELAAPVGNDIVISWEHEAYVWMSSEQFVLAEAQCEFMHRAQEWLRIHELSNREQIAVRA